jgi:hypothetical protein
MGTMTVRQWIIDHRTRQTTSQFERFQIRLQDSTLEELLADIGRTSPRASGSTAALVAAQLGAARAKMGLLVSGIMALKMNW